MIKIKDKRSSHVGMIISFVVFVTFIVFLYSIVRPAINTGQDKKTIADYLVVKIIENVSANFTSTSVEIDSNKNPNKDCVQLQGFLVLSEIPLQTIVQNELRVSQNAFTNSLGDLGIERTDSNNLFFRVYSSPEFQSLEDEGSPDSCGSVQDDDYSIGIIKTEKFPFKNNLDYLIEHYDADYEKIKDNLKIPPGTEFGFGFVQSNGAKIEVGDIPSSIDVYAAEIPIQYIDSNVNIQSGFINIKVW